MLNSISASELLYKIYDAVVRLEDNCEEKQGVGGYCLYDDVLDIQTAINQLEKILDKQYLNVDIKGDLYGRRKTIHDSQETRK